MWLSNVAATDIKHRLPNLNPASAETMSTARTWLQTCTTTHHACGNKSRRTTTGSGILKPRHLIKIFKRSKGSTTDPELCLVETTHIERPKYATLSYCWGGDQPVKLKRGNIISWRSKISFSDLPRTLKDAILVTAELGLEYIWIDALCIIQDDDGDKIVELARMGDIYSHAHVTLLASRSPRVQDGFLQSRYIPRERGFRLPYLCKNGQIGSVILWTGRDMGNAEPIHQRGWCFQEQILSPRILEFGTHQLRYLCTANRIDEVVPETDGWITNSETFGAYGTGHSLDLPAHWYTLPATGTEFLDLWERIVVHYSHLSLSHNTDKLRAISAVARKFGQASSMRYYAGLWAEHLPSQLLWEVDRDDRSSRKPTRAAKWVAPSWSWASIEGPISYSLIDSNSIVCQRLNVIVENATPKDDFSDVLDAEMRLRTLTLHAKIGKDERPSQSWGHEAASRSWGFSSKATRHRADEDATTGAQEDNWSSWHPTFVDPKSGKAWTDIHGQCDEYTAGCNTVLLASITIGRGLILAMQPRTKKYTRVGIFRLDGYSEGDRRWEQRDIAIA